MIPNLPDIGRAAQGLKIAVELEDIPDDNLIAHTMLKQLRENNTKGAIDILMHVAKDNRELAIEVVGKELFKTIENYVNSEP